MSNGFIKSEIPNEIKKKTLKQSIFSFKNQRENDYCIFHSLSLKKIYGNQDIFRIFDIFEKGKKVSDILKEFSEKDKDKFLKTVTQMYNFSFLVEENLNEKELLNIARKELPKKPLLNVMYLILTDKCNFACKYCFVEGNIKKDYKFSSMNEATAKRAIDLFFLNINKKKLKKSQIIFYGGEPLLNKDVFKFAVEYIQENQKKISFEHKHTMMIVTNGTFVDEELAVFFKKNDVEIGISLDGSKEINDQMRIKTDGKGTFEDIINAIEILRRHGIPFGISCTISTHNLDKLEEVSKWFVDYLKTESFDFNILIDTLDKKNPKLNAEKVAKKLISCHKIARDAGIGEGRISRKVGPFLREELYLTDCAACDGQLIIAPDGEIGICHAFIGNREYFFTNVNDIEINEKSLENIEKNNYMIEWTNRTPINIKECWDCVALGICGGGCPYNSFVDSGSIWEVDKRFCPHAIKTVEWLIWDTFDRMNKNEEIVRLKSIEKKYV